ncbi:hypothetical protein AXF42_Ash001402 [Apostasia shenzhenica]|uniref:Uncharacterized protein n=1 Tax=Apostasia shenzhenica TaxID=1088818 RepID=A0A2I0AUT8_9ASPA|nr:hypothetical protein AXF42_Ash001402 [Apostasia shenzhenica]
MDFTERSPSLRRLQRHGLLDRGFGSTSLKPSRRSSRSGSSRLAQSKARPSQPSPKVGRGGEQLGPATKVRYRWQTEERSRPAHLTQYRELGGAVRRWGGRREKLSGAADLTQKQRSDAEPRRKRVFDPFLTRLSRSKPRRSRVKAASKPRQSRVEAASKPRRNRIETASKTCQKCVDAAWKTCCKRAENASKPLLPCTVRGTRQSCRALGRPTREAFGAADLKRKQRSDAEISRN